jgi:hypothetical protein
MRAFLVLLAFGFALFASVKARADAVYVVANTAPAYPGDYRLVAVLELFKFHRLSFLVVAAPILNCNTKTYLQPRRMVRHWFG